MHLDPSLWKQLQMRLRRRKDGVIRDIYDGQCYRKWEVFLDHNNALSLLCNTDGVAIFRSSKSELWPVWLVVNELPPQLRYMANNNIVNMFVLTFIIIIIEQGFQSET